MVGERYSLREKLLFSIGILEIQLGSDIPTKAKQVMKKHRFFWSRSIIWKVQVSEMKG